MESQIIKLDESIFNDLNESRELLESQQGAICYGWNGWSIKYCVFDW